VKQIMEKIGEYSELHYPPIKEGKDAFDLYLSSLQTNSKEDKLKSLKWLAAILMEH